MLAECDEYVDEMKVTLQRKDGQRGAVFNDLAYRRKATERFRYQNERLVIES
jgi:hypothetical protein